MRHRQSGIGDSRAAETKVIKDETKGWRAPLYEFRIFQKPVLKFKRCLRTLSPLLEVEIDVRALKIWS